MFWFLHVSLVLTCPSFLYTTYTTDSTCIILCHDLLLDTSHIGVHTVDALKKHFRPKGIEELRGMEFHQLMQGGSQRVEQMETELQIKGWFTRLSSLQ